MPLYLLNSLSESMRVHLCTKMHMHILFTNAHIPTYVYPLGPFKLCCWLFPFILESDSFSYMRTKISFICNQAHALKKENSHFCFNFLFIFFVQFVWVFFFYFRLYLIKHPLHYHSPHTGGIALLYNFYFSVILFLVLYDFFFHFFVNMNIFNDLRLFVKKK